MKKVLIIYHSQQKGNTKKAAELVEKGCKQVPGVEVELFNTNMGRVDIKKATAADALVFGTPDYCSYMAGGLKQFFDDLIFAIWDGKIIKGKPCAVFVTHGGKGEAAAASVDEMLKALELKKVTKSLVCYGEPKGEAADRAIAIGKALADFISK